MQEAFFAEAFTEGIACTQLKQEQTETSRVNRKDATLVPPFVSGKHFKNDQS